MQRELLLDEPATNDPRLGLMPPKVALFWAIVIGDRYLRIDMEVNLASNFDRGWIVGLRELGTTLVTVICYYPALRFGLECFCSIKRQIE